MSNTLPTNEPVRGVQTPETAGLVAGDIPSVRQYYAVIHNARANFSAPLAELRRLHANIDPAARFVTSAATQTAHTAPEAEPVPAAMPNTDLGQLQTNIDPTAVENADMAAIARVSVAQAYAGQGGGRA